MQTAELFKKLAASVEDVEFMGIRKTPLGAHVGMFVVGGREFEFRLSKKTVKNNKALFMKKVQSA